MLGPPATVEVRWTQTQTPSDDSAGPGPSRGATDLQRHRGAVREAVDDWMARSAAAYTIEEVHQQLQREADDWAADHDGFVVAELVHDGTRTTVDVLGPDHGPVPSLRAALQTVVGPDATVTIWFRPRQLVTDDEDAPTSD